MYPNPIPSPAGRGREQGKGYTYTRFPGNIFFGTDYLQVNQVAINLSNVLPMSQSMCYSYPQFIHAQRRGIEGVVKK